LSERLHNMQNLLLEDVEYKVEETGLGVWRRFVYSSGARFSEFRSHASIGDLPLIHYTSGMCPETGRRIVAKGVIAVGRMAVGVVAIGQASLGLIAIGQLAIGLLFGLGQLTTGLAAIGQIAVGALLGIGQIATGVTAIGQLAFGKMVLGQVGHGMNVWSVSRADTTAVEYFRPFVDFLLGQ